MRPNQMDILMDMETATEPHTGKIESQLLTVTSRLLPAIGIVTPQPRSWIVVPG